MHAHVLVPIAYGPGPDAAAELAAARGLVSPGGTVSLLHVMQPPPAAGIDDLPAGRRAALIAAREADLARQAETVLGGAIVLLEGEPARTILGIAQAEGADRIVLVTHRIDTALFGSTAASVVRHAPCAVPLLR